MSISVGYKGLEHADKDMIFYGRENEMSEVTLHGYPVKVGDEVWSAIYQQYGMFKGLGSFSGTAFCPAYQVEIMGMVVLHSETILFWQPIDPAAIEAAKVKPKPVEHEWQWLKKSPHGDYHTSAYYISEEEAKDSVQNEGYWTLCSRIEESKREVKP